MRERLDNFMKKILIVDDEHSIRFTLKKFLEKEGFDAHTAEDAETALEIINKNYFDVVLSDILLPKISGVKLLQRIFQIRPHTKVIMITGEPNVTTAAEALRLGACDYLFKPVDKQSVVKSVKNALKLKELEDENRSYQENLERQVEERTKELKTAMNQMEEIQSELLMNERLKGLDLISSGIAHDINNSLSPIMIYSEALLERFNGKDSNYIEYIRKIIKSAEEIEKSIKKIDDFNLKSCKDCISGESTEISILFDFVDDFFRENKTIREKKLQLIIENPEEGLFISMKEKAIKDVLIEIINNSIDASFEGGLIKLNAVKRSDNIDIIVSDEGCGMNAEVLEHCFDPYFTTKGLKNNGLGLSQAYGIICRNNGHMNITSSPDNGTEVVLTFALNNLKEISK
jgi:two-component system NtrC family sensor kinase